jgi:AAA+ superfamily predicted ATPase
VAATAKRVQDRAIRPLSLDEYIGQPVVREQMALFIQAARGRSESLDHTLIFGPPGLGKTTLANIIAQEMGVSVKSTWADPGAPGRPGGDADQSRTARCAVHRRNPPLVAGRRGSATRPWKTSSSTS